MCKGNTQTSTTQSGPPPEIMDAYRRILGRAEGVASTPYQQYGGNQIAPFNQDQQGAFQNFSQIPQQYLPTAVNYATQGASPITGGQIEQYYNPFQQGVTDATIGNINETNARQLAQVKGNAISQGALGGNRLGVGQGEVIRQQNLGNAPTLANLNAQNYQQAYGAAAADRAAKSQGAYTFGNLQNAALQGNSAWLQSGALQQQQAQRTLDLPYQQFVQQQAFPYQQTGWLAGLTSGIGSLSGGQGSTTTPAPSPFQQYAGLGLAAAGMFLKHGGKVRGYDQGGGIGMGGMPYGGAQSWIPGMQMARGNGPPPPPKIGEQKDDGASKMVSSAMDLSKQLRGRFSNPFAEQPYDNYDAIYASNELPFGGPRADGGMVMPNDNGIFIPLKGYDLGGGIAVDTFGDRFAPATEMPSVGIKPEALTDSYFAQNGADPRVFTNSWQDNPPLPRARPEIQDEQTGVPLPTPRPQMADQGYTEDTNYPDMAAPTQGIGIPSDGTAGEFNPQGGIGISPKQERGERSFGLGILPESWKAPMIAAGFGMMASRSPFLGQAIGEGGMKGFEAYEGRRKETQDRSQKEREFGLQTRRVDMEADRLSQAAKQAAERLAFDTKRLGETVRQHDVDQMKPVPIGVDKYGQMIYGLRDQKTGKITPIDPQTGEPRSNAPATPQAPNYVIPGPDAEAPASAKPAGTTVATGDADVPPKAILTANDPPMTLNHNFMKGLEQSEPDLAPTVKAIAEGRRPPLPLTRNNAYNRRVMELVQQANPGYEATFYPNRLKTLNGFKSGAEARNITAMNTLMPHAIKLYQAATDLDNSRSPEFNKANQFVRWKFDKDFQDKLRTFETAQQAVAGEAAKVFLGGQQTALADREEWLKKFNPTDPKNAQLASLRTLMDLVKGRLTALGNQYNQGMGTNHGAIELISPETRKQMEMLEHAGKGNSAPKVDQKTRFEQLSSEGMSKNDAFKKMKEEGY